MNISKTTQLLRVVMGNMGTAYFYSREGQHGGCKAADGRDLPVSATFWLVDLQTSVCDEDGVIQSSGVFCVSWLNLDHEMWARFKEWEPGVPNPNFQGRYSLTVQECYGENINPNDPETVEDCAESDLAHNGEIQDAADTHMYHWVKALLDGTLDPYEGYVGREWAEDPEGWYDHVKAQAEQNAGQPLTIGGIVPQTVPTLFEGLE